MNKDIGLREADEMIMEWFRSINVGHFDVMTNFAQLSEEVGEVARIIAREYGDQSWKEGAEKPDLGSELADVIFSVLCIAHVANVDLATAFREKLEKRIARDSKRHQNNPKIT